MRIRVPAGFNLWSTIHSHGWSALPPFRVNRDEQSLRLLLRLTPSLVAAVEVRQSRSGDLLVRTAPELSAAHARSARAIVRSCLRLDEDFTQFYQRAARHPDYRWVHALGAGRMLRSPSVFEDVVKMICTTNCSWALTQSMVGNLCRELGEHRGADGHAFPTSAAMADATEAFLRKRVRAGYRAPYLLEFARSVAGGSLDCESWRTSSLPTEELFEEIRAVKGVGPYAAGNILKLLGRYDLLGIDSWCRARYAAAFHRGRRVTDTTIERRYPSGDTWRGLFFWMDMTKDWYDHGA